MSSNACAAQQKRCSKCEEFKPLQSFHKRAASIDGLAYKCRGCVNANSAAWRSQNPQAHKQWYLENAERKSAYYRRWRLDKTDHLKERMSAWSRENADHVRAKGARRHAAKFRAVPPWADFKAVEAIYAKARQMRCETGERYEVDHIVPLQGKTVCGLHWEGNLQILTQAENISKLNRRWPGMP